MNLKSGFIGASLITSLFSLHVNAQTYSWAHGFTTPVTNGGVSNKVFIDYTSSDIYNVGKFTTNGTTGTDFDPSAGNNVLVTQANTANGFISKYTSAGAAVLAIVFKGGANEVMDITTDISDNMYVTGYYTGTVDFDPTAGTFNLPNTTINRMFIAKINANGTLNWCKDVGGSGNAKGLCIALDPSDNVIVGGQFENTTDFDPGTGTANLVGIGQDGFLLKLSNTGNYIAAVKIGDTGLDAVTDIEVDINGDLFACGYYSSSTAFSGANYAGGIDGFVGKFSTTNLNTTWIKGFGGPQDDTPKGLVQDYNTGGIHCTGYFKGTADFDPGAAVSSFSSPSTTDIDGFVMKLNASGNFSWARQITGTGSQAPQSISIDNLGDLYVGGFYQGITDFNPGTAEALYANNGTSEDIFMLKLNGSGNYIQTQVIGSTANERCLGMAVEPSTGFYVLTGQLNDATAVDFNTTSATNNVTGDWYLAKYTKCSYPPVPVSASSVTVCSGSAATLTVTTGSYTSNWYSAVNSGTVYATGSSVTTPTLTTNYTLYVDNTNSCGTSARSPISVTMDNDFLNVSLSSGTICQGESVVVTASGAQTYNFGAGSSAINTYTTPVYPNTGTWTSSFSGVNANGCSQTKTYTVIVNASPSVSIASAIYSPPNLCDNTVNTVAVTASGSAVTYTWMPGGIVGTSATLTLPSVAGSSNFSLTGTAANGCAKTLTIPVQVNASPSVSIASTTLSPSIFCDNTINTADVTASGNATSYTWMPGNVTGTNATLTFPSTTGTYTVSLEGASANGCSKTVTSTVQVNASPSVTIASTILSPSVFCDNTVNTADVTASGNATSYTWMPGNVTGTNATLTFPSTTGTYTVGLEGASANGCSKTVTSTVQVNASPSVTIASTTFSPSVFCDNTVNTADVTASGNAISYTWMPGNVTGTNATLTFPSVPGTYTLSLTGTALNGCSATVSDNNISVTNCSVGLIEFTDVTTGIKAYPNPFSENVTLEIGEGEVSSVSVVDVLGRLTRAGIESLGNDIYEIKTGDLQRGVYYINVIFKNLQAKTIKVIKQD